MMAVDFREDLDKVAILRFVLGFFTFVSLVSSAWAVVSFEGLGDLAGGSFLSRARAVSHDGGIVVGESVSANGNEAFRWEVGSLEGIGDVPGGGFSSGATGVSGDGSVVIGKGLGVGNRMEAFQLVDNEIFGLQDVPGGPFANQANAISFDSSVIVGFGSAASGMKAVRWDDGVLSEIVGLPVGTVASTALDISHDATVIVGHYDVPSGGGIEKRSFRSQGGIFSPLPSTIIANAISPDGSLIVGWQATSDTATTAVTFKNDQINPLNDLPGGDASSQAFDASDAGRVIVGRGTRVVVAGDESYEAVMWLGGPNALGIKEWLIENFVDEVTDWSLDMAHAVSADGSTIVGWGTNPAGLTEAWRARIVPGDYDVDNDVDLADYALWKETFGSTSMLSADGNHNATVDAADYTIWRDNVRGILNGRSVVSAPEPSTLLLVISVSCVLLRKDVFRRFTPARWSLAHF